MNYSTSPPAGAYIFDQRAYLGRYMTLVGLYWFVLHMIAADTTYQMVAPARAHEGEEGRAAGRRPVYGQVTEQVVNRRNFWTALVQAGPRDHLDNFDQQGSAVRRGERRRRPSLSSGW